MKKRYDQGQSRAGTVDEPPLDDPRVIIGERDKNGVTETCKQLLGNIHERGIRAAGKRSLPFYGLIAFFGLFVLTVAGQAVAKSIPIVGALLMLLSLVSLAIMWVGTPLLIYWDCKAGERYLPQKWRLGKLIAVGSILNAPIGLIAQFLYRAWKL